MTVRYGGEVPTGTYGLYVDASTGNDSNTRAQVLAGYGSVKWQTIGRAVWGQTTRTTTPNTEAAQAGDTVYIAGGASLGSPVTYSTSENVYDTSTPVWNPVNSGTSGSPITFVAVGYVKLASPAANSPTVGSLNKNYISWYANRATGRFIMVCDGLDTGAATTGIPSNDTKAAGYCNPRPDTGPVILAATGCSVEGFDIDGGVQVDYLDNYPGIRFASAQSCTARNCHIVNFRNSIDTVNGTGIQVYDSYNCTIEHNTIEDSGSGIIAKNAPTLTVTMGLNTIRYNRVKNCHVVFEASYVTTGGSTILRSDWYQNIGSGAKHNWRTPGNRGAVLDRVYNNTFYNTTDPAGASAINSPGGEGGLFWNNIIDLIPATAFHYCIEGPMVADTAFDFEHNVYSRISSTFYVDGTLGNRTFAQYQGDWADQDGVAPATTNSDALLVDPANENFLLQSSSSSAWNLGVHPDTAASVHAGAYPANVAPSDGAIGVTA